MRISTQLMMDRSLGRLQDRLSSVERTQSRLATGKQFLVSSENVGGMNTALALRSERAGVAQANKNAEDGRTRVNLADSRLQQILTAMRRARDLAIRGASTLQPAERDAIAKELSSIQEQVVSLANSDYLGQGLFSGFSTDEAVKKVGAVWTYGGDSGAVNRRISESEVVQVNVTGDEIFGFNDSDDMFTMLDQLITDVQAGDTTAVSNALDSIDTATSRIDLGLSRLGAVGNRIETTIGRNLAVDESLRQQLSSTEDVDLTEAILELKTQEVALQATLGAVGRAIQPSLIDFLQ
ncbi:MAG TPA: hypothetical protein ENI86_02950 [Acidimicrobiales bacterium]|nr:hypothetical protein [Acidimicrobiales bacterium]